MGFDLVRLVQNPFCPVGCSSLRCGSCGHSNAAGHNATPALRPAPSSSPPRYSTPSSPNSQLRDMTGDDGASWRCDTARTRFVALCQCVLVHIDSLSRREDVTQTEYLVGLPSERGSTRRAPCPRFSFATRLLNDYRVVLLADPWLCAYK